MGRRASPCITSISHRCFLNALCVLGVLCAIPSPARAQDNYEIQVYAYDTVEPGHTMVELHSNFTFEGSKTSEGGMYPTNHQLHETIEITHGFTDWFETGFYIFTSSKNGQGIDWVGDHIRPRVRIPPKWKWPVGLSLSNEVGYQRRQYSADTWTWEMRPIIDKQAGRWYFSFNPTFDKSIHGLSESQGFVFSPNVKVSYDFTKKITGGLEYYGSVGPATEFRSDRAAATPVFPGHRSESFTQMGSKLWCGSGSDTFHRSPDRENDSWLPF